MVILFGGGVYVIMGLGMFIVDSVLSSLVDSKLVLASLGDLGLEWASLGDVLARLVKADPVDCLRVANGQDSTSCQEVYPKMLMQPPI